MPLSSSPSRRLLARAAGVLGALALALPGAAAPASAAETTAPADTAYRYWGYFQAPDGAWAFAQTGPDASAPADGSVEGWRFAVAGSSDMRSPRALPAFDDVCGGDEAGEGEKRVAVVVDYGRAADAADGDEPPAPRAGCAVVDDAATGADVLAAVAETRIEAGLVCGLDGYPATGCGEAVAEVSPEAAAADEPVELTGAAGTASTADESAADEPAAGDDAGEDAGDTAPGVGLWLGIAAAAAVVALAVAALRRRRDLSED
jgi:hypothetical protein